ncbi:MAG: 2-oxoglutarate and iron-dependent oxygenase domain-containing protein [Thalassobaculaceae bacterium]|nr:2-oxoglutarate and iron-dependent oxygenase domain-containing protein [Thalassobaculaceae bacterium]
MPDTQSLNATAAATELDPDKIIDIDLAPLFRDDPDGRARVVAEARRACERSGFFLVHNTCIDDRVIQDTLTQMDRLFALPDDDPIKQAVHQDLAPGTTGWAPIFEEPSYQENTIAYMESFDAGPDVALFPSAEAAQEVGIWPIPWPDLPGFRDAVETYNAAANRLGRALFEVFSELVGEERGFFNRMSGDRAPKTLRLLHYPANDAPADDINVGIAAHTDFECFTIMYQTAPGLELTDVEGNWHQAPAAGGRFTIILGDMMERFTNGTLPATGHRVVNTPWQRYSLILFYAVDGDQVVAPLPQFVGPDRPARYPPVGQYAHIRNEVDRSVANLEAMTAQQNGLDGHTPPVV